MPAYNLNGTICANLIGLQVRGNFLTCAGAFCPVDFYTGFELWANVGFMGEIMLAGSFLADGNDVAIKANARVEIDFEKVRTITRYRARRLLHPLQALCLSVLSL